MKFSIEPVKLEHARELGALHARTLEGYFLSKLGPQFLRWFYEEFCLNSFDHGVVARCRESGRLVGFVTGTSDARAHFRQFYRRHGLGITWTILLKAVSNAALRRAIIQRAGHIRLAVGLIAPWMRNDRSRKNLGHGPADQCPVRLLSIVVDPAYQGTGVARLVAEGFEQVLRKAGHKRVGLSVMPENKRGIAFYEKTGWQVTHRSEKGWWFEKDL